MALQKQAININFASGIDTKTDPKQVTLGKFLSLQNAVFQKGGLLQKRNGYKMLTHLPDNTAEILETFNGDLTAIGENLEAYTAGVGKWYERGELQPVSLSTQTLIRNNTNQSQSDTAFSPSGFTCTVYTDQTLTSLSTPIYKYTISDTATGQTIIAPTILTDAFTGVGTPKVFLLGNNFIILYTGKISTVFQLQYLVVSTLNPVAATVNTGVITTSYTPATTVNFDAVAFNNSLYIAWNGASSSGIKMRFLTASLSLSSTFNPDPSHQATLMSVAVDAPNQIIWVSYYNLSGTTGYTFAVDPFLATLLAPTHIISSGTLLNITATASLNVLSFFYEVSNSYSYDSGIPTNFVDTLSVTLAGTVSSPLTVLRSVGLASKSFLLNNTIYCLFVYQSPYQPTYFLADSLGNVVAKLAYSNGGGYYITGLPSVSVIGLEAFVSYLFKDLIQAVNKNTNVPAGSQVNGIYSQTGINLVTFDFDGEATSTAEIGSNLNLTGGFLWGYDGYTPVENGFFVWPDSVEATTATTGGNLDALIYFYQFTYEWTDNQGNAFRSAPSIPLEVDLTGAGTSTSVNTLNVPTLRLTYKIANPVKLVGYRWSTAQQVYYQFTSITAPILNDPTVDSIAIVDTLADATILGNNLLYTTGGVLENIGGPAFDTIFLFDNRLFGIDAENKDLIWFSKQIIQGVPVEMSDLLTIYVAPNIGAQGSTGSLRCGAVMDDKVILFKDTALNYINGIGPDNTGANNQYSQPTFITSTVGCSNQKSIIFQPQGLMFEFASDAGNQIWLLGRDLSTSYIGAPVEELTKNATILSTVTIPGANEVRFILSSGITLIYDYYYGQWNNSVGIPAVSSTLYQGLHTYLNSFSQVFQETPGEYLDGSNPVLMSFTTSWITLAGLQGYQRAYFFYLLGQYFSPHKLQVLIAYDFNPNPVQQSIIFPSNYAPVYGLDTPYGQGSPYGGSSVLEQWRIFFGRQRCEAFQISVSEIYDPKYGVSAGAGLSLSGINVVVGIKKGYRPIRADHSVG